MLRFLSIGAFALCISGPAHAIGHQNVPTVTYIRSFLANWVSFNCPGQVSCAGTIAGSSCMTEVRIKAPDDPNLIPRLVYDHPYVSGVSGNMTPPTGPELDPDGNLVYRFNLSTDLFPWMGNKASESCHVGRIQLSVTDRSGVHGERRVRSIDLSMNKFRSDGDLYDLMYQGQTNSHSDFSDVPKLINFRSRRLSADQVPSLNAGPGLSTCEFTSFIQDADVLPSSSDRWVDVEVVHHVSPDLSVFLGPVGASIVSGATVREQIVATGSSGPAVGKITQYTEPRPTDETYDCNSVELTVVQHTSSGQTIELESMKAKMGRDQFGF